MKKIILSLAVLLTSTASLVAQNVGIGTTAPDASAVLDVSSNNKGILLPRVSLLSNADAVTVPAPAQYLIVYNTSTSMANGLRGAGMYANTGTPAVPVWQKAATGAAGAEGPAGPQGPVGPAGPQGQTGPAGPNGKLVNTASGGGIVGSIPGGSTVYVFACTPSQVTITATQAILLWGNLQVGLVAGSPNQTFDVGAGIQSNIPGSPIINMAGSLYTTVAIGPRRENISFAGKVIPGAGTWKIGPAIKNQLPIALTDNDYANFIYMIVEQ